MHTTPTTEDRIWAVLAHLSALSFGMGILLPVVGWSDQRRKSNYAAFQCLQALGYQSVGFTVWVLIYLVIIILGSIVLLAVGINSGETPSLLQNAGVIVFSLLVFGLLALYLVLPIIAAIACAWGKDFRYPVLGGRLARYVRYDPSESADPPAWLDEDQEFRWVAAMGHFSILIVLWGMLAPLTAWILQGKNSLFLKFQSMQTLVYQAIATVLFVAGLFLYVFGLLLLVASMGAIGSADLNSSVGSMGILLLAIFLLISIAVILCLPLLHILGQWAGYRVLKGEDYRYPWIGKFVETWSSNRSVLKEKPV